MMSSTTSRLALAIASGLALALAFPKFDFNLFAWIALVPLLLAVHDQPLKLVFGYGWLQGLAFYAGSLYWIVIPLHSFAGVALWIAFGPMLLLAAFEALYPAFSLLAAEFVTRRLRVPLVVTFPIAWAGIEWLHAFFPAGFPWNLLGYAAWRNLELIQFAEFTGVYGVSALIVFFNAVVFIVVFRQASRRVQIVSLATLSALMAGAWTFGAIRMSQLDRVRPAGRIKFALAQGNIPQSLKWDPQALPTSFAAYSEETEAAARQGADIVVWPETAAAFFFQPDGYYPPAFASEGAWRDRLLDLARSTGDALLFGAPAIGIRDGRFGTYNRAYLVSGRGEVEAHYDKMQLVPFGEYVPLRGLFGRVVNKVVEGMLDIIPGSEQTLFDFKGAKLGVLVCYESAFPDLTRREVKRGADILVNITNDAWYGQSSAPYQSLAMAAMRSVETKVPMVRVANTGITAVITPTGKVTASTDLFTRAMEIEQVAWRPMRTIYTIAGDLFAESCFALTAIGLAWSWFRPRRQKPLEAFASSLLSSNGSRRRKSRSTPI